MYGEAHRWGAADPRAIFHCRFGRAHGTPSAVTTHVPVPGPWTVIIEPAYTRTLGERLEIAVGSVGSDADDPPSHHPDSHPILGGNHGRAAGRLRCGTLAGGRPGGACANRSIVYPQLGQPPATGSARYGRNGARGRSTQCSWTGLRSLPLADPVDNVSCSSDEVGERPLQPCQPGGYAVDADPGVLFRGRRLRAHGRRGARERGVLLRALPRSATARGARPRESRHGALEPDAAVGTAARIGDI